MPVLGEHLKTLHGSLATLVQRAGELAGIDRALRDWLGAPLSERVRLANLRDGAAVILADSAATLTFLRFRNAELLEFLQARVGASCERIELKVDPALSVGYSGL